MEFKNYNSAFLEKNLEKAIRLHSRIILSKFFRVLEDYQRVF